MLLVEADPADARLIQRRLQQVAALELSTVGSLVEAIAELCSPLPPDVVLTDLRLPDANGARTVGALREVNAWVPILVLTDDAGYESGVEALQAGADEFFSKKDIGRVSLHRALRFAIERHKLQSEMRALVLDHAEPMLVLDREGTVLFANPAAGTLFAEGEESRLLGRRFELPQLTGWHEIRVPDSAGYPIDVEVRTSPVSWQGRMATLGVFRDLREYKALEREAEAAERAREESDSRLKLVLSELPVSLWTTDTELCVRSLHGARELGPRFDGSDPLPLEQASQHPQLLEAHREALVRGSARFQYQQGERAVEGIVRRVRSRDNDADALLLGFAMEVTERRNLESQLAQAQKMDAVGRLAGGVAHDFNNLLTGILSFAHFIMQRLEPADRSYEDVQEIVRIADQAAAMTRQLLSFARRQTLEPRVVDPSDSIDNGKRLLRRLVSTEIDIEAAVDENLWRIKVDPNAFEQVLLNLCVNARDAMPEGGMLRIVGTNVSVAEDGPLDLADGEYVRVSVIDNGCGMSPDVVAQAFEPFFTTKREGEGTGLGLSIVYGIVQQSGGSVRIESRPDKGTSVHLYWPRTQEKPRARSFIIPAEAHARPDETILLVEDDHAVRHVVQRMLEEVGYHVLPAADGAEAMWRAREHHGAIHLVLTDLVMPQINGRTLATRLSASRPDSKLLFLSGHGEAAESMHDLPSGELVVSKPLTPARLTAAVRQALDRGTSLGDLPRRRRVLVVDDDGGVLRATDRLLRDNWEVVLANRGRDAVHHIDHDYFDVILCDLMMPEMNGLELHNWARVQHPEAARRFVFITGAVGDRFIDGFLENAGRPVLEKPMDPSVMRELVQRTAEHPA